MKLKTLGITLIAMLAACALLFSLCLTLLASRFDAALQSITTMYSDAVLPLRQIDANTKNLRFQLLAAVMHDPSRKASALHDHSIAFHLDTIETEINKNEALWEQLETYVNRQPDEQLRELRHHYVTFYRDGIAPSFHAARQADWDGVIGPITTTLAEYEQFERLLQQSVDRLQAQAHQRYAAIGELQHQLFLSLFALVLLVLISAIALAWRSIARHSAQLQASNDELRRHRDHLEELVAERTAAWQSAAAQAQGASRAKTQFLSNMSHELRTPMNAILGFSALVRRMPGLPPAQQQNLDIISRSGAHLLSLINDVLDMSKIEAGRTTLDLAPFDLHATVRDVVDLMQERAESRGLQLQVQQSSQVPRCVRGDQGKLRQVLINLLSNAIKFTMRGSVVLGLETRPDGQLRFRVADSGPGIAPEHAARVFEPFVQVGNQSEQKGTGLGLTITRQFVQLMEGSIRLDSTVGVGSVFQVDLPLPPANVADLPATAGTSLRVQRLAPDQPTWRILVVEDQPDNALLIERLLEAVGFQVQVARDGASGVAAFSQWRPHFIWMDRRMPGMDGSEACRRIRALPGGEQVCIVGLTASILPEDRGALLAAGMDEILCKPYRESELFDCMARLLGTRYRYEEAAFSESEPDTAPLARLARLSPALRQRLREALFSLDDGAIASIIDQISAADIALGAALSQLVAQSNHSPILHALQEVT